MRAVVAASLAALVFPVGHAAAQEGAATPADYAPTVLDLAVPESPAAAALAGNYETVLKPSTPRDFTANLLGLRDPGGGLTPGVSMEFTPSFFTSRDVLPSNYATSYGLRAALNTQVSFATAEKDESSGKVPRISAGLRVPLLDEGDPRWDPKQTYRKCVEGRIKPPELPRPTEPGETSKPLSEADLKVIDVCQRAVRHANWNAQSIVLGAAQIWARDDTSRKLESDAQYYWLSWARPFGGPVLVERKQDNSVADIRATRGQYIVQVRHIRHAMEVAENAQSRGRYDSNAFALRVRYGSESFNFSLAGSAERQAFEQGSRHNVRTVSGGFEGRLMKDVWIRLTVGNERRSGGDEPFAFMNFAWSTDSAPAYQTPSFR